MEKRFDILSFQKRTGLNQRELSEKLGCSSGLVGNWAIGRAVPSYDKIGDLLALGMTIQELFGPEIADVFQNFNFKEKENKNQWNREVFMDGVKAADELIAEGYCSTKDFIEIGGWMRSTTHGNQPIYFVYCGGMTKNNKIYLNTKTGNFGR